MAESIIITFAGDTEIKATLESWAKEEDRSVSWIIRKLIEAEKIRRMKQLVLTVEPTGEDSPTVQMRATPVNDRVQAGAAELVPIV